MKKFMMIGLALCLVFAVVGEAMAIEADFSGALRVRGRYIENPQLLQNGKASDRFDERFRLKSVFKANDNVSATFRADFFESTLGGAGSAEWWGGEPSWNSVRAYMTVKSDYGVSAFGRMAGGAWGSTFGDYEGEFDRLRHTIKIDNLTAGFILQKMIEGDYGAQVTDQDLDVYYLFGVYGMENMKFALLYAYVDYAHLTDRSGQKHAFLPYFKGNFGPFGFEAEVIIENGTWEFADSAISDVDIDTLTYFAEATWASGPFGAELGWASQSGQDDSNDSTAGNTLYGGMGEDWDKMLIFGDVSQLLNLSGTGVVTVTGADMWYVGFSYQAMENLKLWFNVAGATMNEDQGFADDDYGIEYDANLTWTIMPNLTYTIRAGFLSAGDGWKYVEPGGGVRATAVSDVDDTWAAYHKLQMTF